MAATLFELLGKIKIDDAEFKKKISDSSKNIQDFGGKLGSAIGKVAKVGVAAAGAIGAAGVVIAKQSMEAYAEYEQLAGGAQLLFGDAYQFIADKAKNAYSTVQMSQNDYLQQVNGFAVGLKTAMGGNEQAAAELADRIINAQADVVAATGNSQEAVQNAFNGIMKSNFTMLDNLQLGITPTKEGFQEVIDKVNDWNKANGKATNYQIDNLADCQAALVDYIEMQGLAGYAANEAAGTISGSVAMTKASWSNLLTAFADENADLSEATGAFMESVATAAGNIVPRVIEIFKGIAKAMPEVIAQAKEKLFEAFPELEAKLIAIEEWIDKYKGVLIAVAAAIGVVTAAIGLHNAVAAIKLAMDAAQVTTLGGLIAAKLASAAATIAAIAPYVLIVAAIAAVIAIIVLCVQHWDTIKAKVIEVAENIALKVQEIKDNVTQKFEELKTQISEKWEAIKTGAIEKWEALKTSVAEKIEALKTSATEKFEAIKSNIISKIDLIKTNAVTKFDTMKANVLSKWEEIKSGIAEKIQSARDTVSGAIDAIKGFFNFEWSLPPLKLPHVSISGSFSLNPPSVPKFSISWYKKAMDNPMLLTDPTIFGFNAKTGNFLGGGEAGAEVVSGANTLMNMIGNTVDSKNDRIIAVLEAILNALSNGGGNNEGMVIDLTTTLDGAVLAQRLYKYNKVVNTTHGKSFVTG